MRHSIAKYLLASTMVMGFTLGAMAKEHQVLVVLSQTGPVAFIGVPATNGVKLGVDEINATNFFGNGDTIKLIVEDDGGDRAQVFTLLNTYGKGDPATLAVIGPVTPALGGPGGGLANEIGIPLIAVSNSPSILATGKYAFIGLETPKTSVPDLAKFAVEKLAVKKCALVTTRDSDGYVEMSNLFTEGVKGAGVEVVENIQVKRSETDFTAVATKIAALNPDCVYLTLDPAAAANAIMLMKQYGLDPATKIFGTQSLASKTFLDVGGAAVEGVYLQGEWVPGGGSEAGKAFTVAYEQKYNAVTDNWAPLGYSLAYVVADAIKRGLPEPTRDQIRENIATSSDVPVIIGHGKFSISDGNQVRYGMRLLQVKDGKFVAAD